MKNVINLENYYLPWMLEHKIGGFIEYYNHQRVHEALINLRPADVYCGRARDATSKVLGRKISNLSEGPGDI